MLRKKTLFTVGAGASAEFGLPTGAQLKKQIISLLSPASEVAPLSAQLDGHVIKAAEAAGCSAGELRAVCDLIKSALPQFDSIDTMLDSHREQEFAVLVGKAAIARAILDAEKSSLLRTKSDGSFAHLTKDKLENTWLPRLFRIVARGCDVGNVANIFQNCRFITFNYDRCIEHYFTLELNRSFAIEMKRAEEIVAQLGVKHVYGSLGSICARYGGGQPHVTFGSDPKELTSSIGNIGTFTEQSGSDVARRPIRNLFQDAKRIVFLGFGYNRQNLDFLSNSGASGDPDVFGTYLQGEGSDSRMNSFLIDQMQHDLRARFVSRPEGRLALLFNTNCYGLIDRLDPILDS